MTNRDRIARIRKLHEECMTYLEELYNEQNKILARVLSRKEEREKAALRKRIR